jgi:hypothetical protein
MEDENNLPPDPDQVDPSENAATLPSEPGNAAEEEEEDEGAEQ